MQASGQNSQALVNQDAIVAELVTRLGSANVETRAEVCERYLSDWHGDQTGAAIAVLRPADTAGVSAAVTACRDLGVAIVPQGGNTGLVLGAVPISAGGLVILSLERMNRIRTIDAQDYSAVVEAGCILETVKDAVEKEDCFFPLALGAQGTCQIGGNVSTNAGGVNVLRYGMTREQVLGLEVVLADGRIWNGLSTLRKDNRGLDLKQLFIGSEGVLGIVTAAALKLSPKPAVTETALVALNSVEDVMTLYRRARRECCDLITAFELIPSIGLSLAREALPDLPKPIDESLPVYALIEISCAGPLNLREMLETFFERGFQDDLILDGVIASSHAQARSLWLYREGMNEGQARRGTHLRTDISVPLSKMAQFIEEACTAVTDASPDSTTIAYGHVGDGNVHLNVLPPEHLQGDERAEHIHATKKIINQVLDRYNGSISAEHGIGRLKLEDFEARVSDVQADIIRAIKGALDPQTTLNPGCGVPRISAPHATGAKAV